MADSSRPQHRIAKLLARAGVASRREVERMIAEGRVAKDGVVLDTPATLLPSLHGVTVDGQEVAAPAPARLFLFHKPAGVLTTERDPGGRPTIYDRLPKDLPRLVPVGRLDLNTEGLLLMTTDGALKRQLELPSTGIERAYRARAYGRVSQEQLEDLIDGVEIDGIRYGPIDANLERRTGANVWIEMILTEGKNREVRRVLEHLDLQVGRLIRIRYGPFVLGDLPVGEVGEVRAADLAAFRQTLARDGAKAASRAEPVTAPRPVRRAPPGAPRADAPRAQPARPPATRASPSRAPTPGASPRPARPAPKPASARPARAASKPLEPPVVEATAPARPARIKRKAGWATPKPKTGPKRPRRS
ncbi:pseudouridine synthase [Sphingomonas corticis]|jgi:23S rRNA pseudouridine2605 synthase|uniref:Pseudouridine synthase n=1 Tax=Sphingomonas corticis TaxID=2722791 RepID=A0ABX1CGL1_9SPHN|nr:pseudouridine synthase [Sphingomonas corticis]NJR77149.1 pseudouridine synthase [Sphingomonas corticis]